ncbi:MAG: MepB family protein [Sphingobacteriaceae bacterium]|nr:MepB family protein [Sphingobacteriaceae bacterium]
MSNLLQAIEIAYSPAGFQFDNFTPETESTEYKAADFKLNQHKIKYREAKITPTKVGLFVTFWKRNTQKITEPYTIDDDFDFLIIGVENENNFGQFIFSKATLCQNGILSHSTKEGKRGFRVYPPWSETTNKQAQKTQQWQCDFYFEISNDEKINSSKLKMLL